jgi:hypothetical protein
VAYGESSVAMMDQTRGDHALQSNAVHVRIYLWNDRSWRILLQKSFWGGERKFLEPLMRLTRGDVRGHIVSSKIDHRPPWRR